MEGTPAIYLGRIIDKNNFRAFIYGANGQRRLVESWQEFEANMQSGIWFATLEDANATKVVVEEPESVNVVKKSKSKPKQKPKAKPVFVEEVGDESDDSLANDGSVFEVTDNEF